MKKLLLLLFSSLLYITASAQSLTVKGTVIDSATKQPVSFATVALVDGKTNSPATSNLTKDDGSFLLKSATGKSYNLAITFVGYNNKTIVLTTTTGDIDLGKILLVSTSKSLSTVNVNAVKPLMKQEVDRISYDVQADPESKSLTALDMMRKVPLLTVDASDAIKLKGSGNYKILINGKESALMAKNPSDVLRSMPGTNIVKIEVITTPPAKYDAEGLAGIINIITTKNVDQGYNIGFNTRYNTVWGPGFNLNGTVKQGKFGFSGYAGMGKQNRVSNPYGNTQQFLNSDGSINQTLYQNGGFDFAGNYKYANGELSFDIDSLNLLTASFDINTNKNNQNSSGLTYIDSVNTITQKYIQSNKNNSQYTGIDAGLNYQLGFKKSKDQLLTLSYMFSYSPNTQATNSSFQDETNYPQNNYNQYNNNGNREHTIQVDYAQPFKKLSVEAGAKAILRNNFSNFHTDTLSSLSDEFEPEPSQTNDFNYRQNVYSLYNSYQLKLEKWTAKAGLRFEETKINADFTSENSTLKTDYNNLIPSLSVQRTFKGSSVSLGFTQRIQRPDISQLNPFVDKSNPQFVNTGNANLKPELDQVFELNYSYFAKGSVNITLSYAFSNNSIQNITHLQTDTINGKPQTVTYTTYDNVGSNKTFGLNLNTNYPITKKLQLGIDGQISNVWLRGYYNGELYNNSGLTGNMFMNTSYKFDDGYRIGVNAGYISGGVTLQGGSSYFIFSQAVVSKTFLEKNATVSLVANNPWARYWHGDSYSRTNEFYQQSTYLQTYRAFTVRLSYKFGKLNSDIKKNQHSINNDDQKGSNKGNNNQ